MSFFIELLKVVFLGIVEGITEWLPISSTGHLIIVERFLQLQVSQDPAKFKSMFEVVIQLGAIMAVVVIYFQKLWPFGKRKSKSQKVATINLWIKVVIASIPAAVIGIPLDDWMDEHLRGAYVVAAALIVYGILFIILENRNKHKSFKINNVSQISYKTALGVGLFQVLALIPGTSRSGSTILGAMLIGMSRGVAAEFSFFMSIPAMFGASAIKLLKFGFAFTAAELTALIVGMLVAFIVSIIAINFLMSYIKKNDFKIFGYYRIILGIILLTGFIAGIF